MNFRDYSRFSSSPLNQYLNPLTDRYILNQLRRSTNPLTDRYILNQLRRSTPANDYAVSIAALNQIKSNTNREATYRKAGNTGKEFTLGMCRRGNRVRLLMENV